MGLGVQGLSLRFRRFGVLAFSVEQQGCMLSSSPRSVSNEVVLPKPALQVHGRRFGEHQARSAATVAPAHQHCYLL